MTDHNDQFSERIALFSEPNHRDLLCCNLRGIERETLRTDASGEIVQTPHPTPLGSALTHPWITTDYSEALLEFITDPSPRVSAVLEQLRSIHQFTAQNLPEGERLWSNSIPGILKSDEQIPVAQYGSSNVGQMKTIYRQGLGLRYGRKMQTIAGIHFNFSVPAAVWSLLRSNDRSLLNLQDYKTQSYFGLIRNFRRWFWLLLYCMGASPIVSKCFVEGRRHNLIPFPEDPDHLYLPHATSLRMGDLGYQSSAQDALYINYNQLSEYIGSLKSALMEPYADYEALGNRDTSGKHQQLSTAVLQIENEFYSTVRPKQTARSGETQLKALMERGVEYVEVRCVDINPYSPLGIDKSQINFLEVFLLTCLFESSPETDENEYTRILRNQKVVVNRGRAQGLMLECSEGSRPLDDWGRDILAKMHSVAEIMDGLVEDQRYQTTVSEAVSMIEDPDLTPSARLIADIQSSGKNFLEWTIDQSDMLHNQLVSEQLAPEVQSGFVEQAQHSIASQTQIEREDKATLDDFLTNYFEQYSKLEL